MNVTVEVTNSTIIDSYKYSFDFYACYSKLYLYKNLIMKNIN